MEFLQSVLASLPGACAQGLIWGLMAIGLYITYKVLDIADLTVDGTMATGGAVCVVLITNGVPTWVALLAAMAAGMLAGLITGLFHTQMGIPAILAGILTQLGLYSVNLRILGFGTAAGTAANKGVSVDKYDLLVSMRYLNDPDTPFWRYPIFVIALFALALIVLLYWFFGTELGCGIRATGANRAMSRAQGINTKYNTVLGLMLSNGIVALASALYAQYQGFADVNAGRGAIVIGLAAVIIGEVIFGRIFRNFALQLLSAVIGAILYFVVIQFVLKLGLDSNDLKLLTALIVALFLAVPYWKSRFLSRHAVKGGADRAAS